MLDSGAPGGERFDLKAALILNFSPNINNIHTRIMSAYVNGRASGLTPAMHQSSVNIRPRALRKKILRSFKLHGLHLRTDAVNALSSVLCQEEDVDASLEAVLSSLSKKLQRLGGRGASSQGHRVHGGVVDLGIIEEIVAELTKDSEDRLREALTVVSAYDHPRLCFDPVKKSFYFYDDRQSSRKGEANAASPGSAARFTRPGANSPGKSTFASRPFHGSAQDKVEMFRERFMLVRQRVRRNEHFSKSSSGSAGARAKQGGGAETASIELTPIDSLLGAKGTLVLLGMLTQREDGKYHLEDLNGSIPVNLSRARITKGLFTLGCIVVMEGAINEVNGEFIVETMGFPPPESREQVSRCAYTRAHTYAWRTSPLLLPPPPHTHTHTHPKKIKIKHTHAHILLSLPSVLSLLQIAPMYTLRFLF